MSVLEELARAPHRHDFYLALRRIECLNMDKPRLGAGLRPVDDPLRLGQDASLSFAPAPIARLAGGKDGRPPRLIQRIFGVLGPNGPLPLHITDYARERVLHHGDHTLVRFLDVFHHRLLSLFYRAWAQAQPTVSLDRPKEDRFHTYVGSLIGVGTPALRERDAAGDAAKLFHAGLLARQVRNADGLEALLSSYFRGRVRVEQFVGHWMALPAGDRTRLGRDSAAARLGGGAVLGGRVWDRQHRIRIHVGPLALARYLEFLPGGSAFARLVALVRQYLGLEFAWDLRLELAAAEVPRTRLGGFGQLGWTSWVGRAGGRDRGDLILDPEGVLARRAASTQQTRPA
jgi:type VI secretion system protein ImpH